MNKVLIILGATGVGKTDISLKLAKKFDMEIISADSVQVFKEFDIGSAKIKKDEMAGIPHYGIDILSAEQEFSACDFVTFAKSKIKEILSKGKTPLIVGGTGLYIKSLVEGYNFGGSGKHEDFREEMEKVFEVEGLEGLYKRLTRLSPQIALNIDKQNKVRLIRALEIATFGGEKKMDKDNEFDYKLVSIDLPREILYQKINLRTKTMIENGLTREVEYLYKKYGDCQPMRAIGYKEVVSYLKGEIDKDQLYDLISMHTRNYAKRQLTFIRGMQNVSHFDISQSDANQKLEEEIESWLNLQ